MLASATSKWGLNRDEQAALLRNKGRTEQFQRTARLWRTGPSPAGGRRRGGLGPRDGIPYQTANSLPVSNQRLPEILDGWHLPGGSRLETRTDTRCTRPAGAETEAGTTEGIRCTTSGENGPQLRELFEPGKAQNAGPTESAFLWSTQKLEPHATQGLFPIEQPGTWAT